MALSYNKKKILIVLLGALGDVTRGLSLAVRIKEAWPDCHLSWAVEPKSREIVEALPHVDKVFVFDRPRGFKAYLSFIAELRREKFDLVLDLQRHLKSGVTSWSTGAATRVGFHRANANEFNWIFNNQHITRVEHRSAKIDHYHLFGDLLGLPPMSPYRFGLKATAAETEKVRSLVAQQRAAALPKGTAVVALLVGSTWSSKFWFAQRYREVIEQLSSEHKVVFVLIGAPNERGFADEIAQGFSEDLVVNLAGKTSVRDLIAVFEQTDLAIGSDSGPMHIAAAVGIPVVSVWGATDPRRSGPYGNEKWLVKSQVACSPCYKRVCPGLGTLCMSEIPSKAVSSIASAIISTPQPPVKHNNTVRIIS